MDGPFLSTGNNKPDAWRKRIRLDTFWQRLCLHDWGSTLFTPPVASKRETPCGYGLVVGDEVVDSKRVTPAPARDVDGLQGSRDEVAMTAAALCGE